MQYNVQNICEDYDFVINGVSFAGNPIDGTALFVTKKMSGSIKNLTGHANCIVFVEDGIDVPSELKQRNCIITSADPMEDYTSLAIALRAQELQEKSNRHYTHTQDGCMIGENVAIGERCIMEPGCFIDHDVTIGDDAFIGCGSIIRNASIGNRFSCQEHAVIGTEAYFFSEKSNVRIPSFGSVVIGNGVSLGSNTVIERGFNTDTIICDRVKVDSCVCIGHDANIGNDVRITCGANLAGFVTVGDNAYIAMNSTIMQRTTIGAESTVGIGATVIGNVKPGVTVLGNPARKLKI